MKAPSLTDRLVDAIVGAEIVPRDREKALRSVVRVVVEVAIADDLDELEPRRDTVPACAPTLPPPPDAA